MWKNYSVAFIRKKPCLRFIRDCRGFYLCAVFVIAVQFVF